MALEIKLSKQYKKDLKTYKNDKKVQDELKKVLNDLCNGNQLDRKYNDHPLHGKYKQQRDIHVFPNVVLIYKISENILYLTRIGTHNKLEIDESVNTNVIKLTISEDTACVPSKTSYIEDGFDKNGIYYFGKKPTLPMSWRDNFKIKAKQEKLKERYSMKLMIEDTNMIHHYFEIDSKPVKDSDGFWSEYTMYMEVVCPTNDWVNFLKSSDAKNGKIPEKWINRYVFVFGDRDYYEPEDADYDYECESKEEAYEWFENYEGFDDEDDDENSYASNWNGY